MTRLSITHRTRYGYAGEATTSYNEIRMTPLTDATQSTRESSITITPQQAIAMAYRDYWGTRVSSFDLHTPHTFLEVEATSEVVTLRPEGVTAVVPARQDQPSVSWAELEDPHTVHEFSDFLPQTDLTALPQDRLEEVRALRAADPRTTAEAVIAWLAGTMTYEAGSTTVQHTAADALSAGKGVCQDLAHIGIGALRTLGIPARYVSGYIHPHPEAAVGETVAGESHAWLEWWDGTWRSWDPTNHIPAGPLHVIVGRGREYRDVTPMKGIVNGGATESLDVEVLITRLD
jgi:transglutaminase-like putative cysteine protease